jgi:hypothetical protein
MSEEGRGGSQSVNRNAARQTARAMLLAAKGKTANCPTVGSDEHQVLRRTVSHTPSISFGSLVEPPVLEDGNLNSDINNKHSNDTEVKFKRIVIAKTAVINMMKHNNHK